MFCCVFCRLMQQIHQIKEACKCCCTIQSEIRWRQRAELHTGQPNPGSRGGCSTCYELDEDQGEELQLCLWVEAYSAHIRECRWGLCGNVLWEVREILCNMKLFTSLEMGGLKSKAWPSLVHWVLSSQDRMRKSSDNKEAEITEDEAKESNGPVWAHLMRRGRRKRKKV